MSMTDVLLTATALIQLPAPFDSLIGKAFLAILGFLIVLFVGRIVMNIAWKIALVAGVGLGAFLLVTTVLV